MLAFTIVDHFRCVCAISHKAFILGCANTGANTKAVPLKLLDDSIRSPRRRAEAAGPGGNIACSKANFDVGSS